MSVMSHVFDLFVSQTHFNDFILFINFMWNDITATELYNCVFLFRQQFTAGMFVMVATKLTIPAHAKSLLSSFVPHTVSVFYAVQYHIQ